MSDVVDGGLYEGKNEHFGLIIDFVYNVYKGGAGVDVRLEILFAGVVEGIGGHPFCHHALP